MLYELLDCVRIGLGMGAECRIWLDCVRIDLGMSAECRIWLDCVRIDLGMRAECRIWLAIFLFSPGVFYNIICVPPKQETDDDSLQGSKVLCSIAPADKGRPSYYHSFGKTRSIQHYNHSLFLVFFL